MGELIKIQQDSLNATTATNAEEIGDVKNQHDSMSSEIQDMSQALCTISKYDNNCLSKFYDAKFESGLWAHQHSPANVIDGNFDTKMYSWKDNEIFIVYLRNPCIVTEFILYPQTSGSLSSYTGIN